MRSVLYSRCDDQLWEGLFPSPLVSVNHLACLCDHMPFFQQGCVGGRIRFCGRHLFMKFSLC